MRAIGPQDVFLPVKPLEVANPGWDVKAEADGKRETPPISEAEGLGQGSGFRVQSSEFRDVPFGVKALDA